MTSPQDTQGDAHESEAVDTSVVILALLETAEPERVAGAKQAMAACPSIPAHARLEAFSVMTRLPAPLRLMPEDARALLDAQFATKDVLAGSEELQKSIVERLEEAGIAGGAAYDALVGLTAAEHGAVLISCDRRSQRTYERLGIPHRMIAVHTPGNAG